MTTDKKTIQAKENYTKASRSHINVIGKDIGKFNTSESPVTWNDYLALNKRWRDKWWNTDTWWVLYLEDDNNII